MYSTGSKDRKLEEKYLGSSTCRLQNVLPVSIKSLARAGLVEELRHLYYGLRHVLAQKS